ncbi:MAG TPA: hypothetical protein VE777_00810 [Gaiellales bacterium]|jgi:hypothetical protein|nr:hypothetical protein [Gaiellales bacterium]
MTTTRKLTPLGAVSRGIAAGVVGTACMTAVQEVMARRRPVRAGTATEEKPDDPWAKAPAPAQLARRVIEGVFQREVSADRIPLFTNAVHWGYGTAMGGLYGILQGTLRDRPAVHGPLFGLGVWASSYATLVPLGLYEPPWHYKASSIAKDVSYHLAYGSGVAAGYELFARNRRGHG